MMQIGGQPRCYYIQYSDCVDCPSQTSKFCNPSVEGAFERCSEFTMGCATGICQEVTTTTGPGCPP